MLAAGLLLIVVNLARSARHGEPASHDPFHGGTLEWTIPSPPPHYNFAVIPTVTSPYPNWDDDDRADDDRKLDRGELVLEHGHETPVSTVNDARLYDVVKMPAESPWPIVLAALVTIAFAFLVTSHFTTAIGFFALGLLALAGWHANEPAETT